jgi:hypothetical protein
MFSEKTDPACLLDLLSKLEDGGSKFFRNLDKLVRFDVLNSGGYDEFCLLGYNAVCSLFKIN